MSEQSEHLEHLEQLEKEENQEIENRKEYWKGLEEAYHAVLFILLSIFLVSCFLLILNTMIHYSDHNSDHNSEHTHNVWCQWSEMIGPITLPQGLSDVPSTHLGNDK